MTQTDKIALELQQARDAYYNHKPLMSDAAYDALEDTLRKLDANHPHFQKVGAPAPTGGAWPKVTHEQPMGSLNKVVDKDSDGDHISDWAKSCGVNSTTRICVSDKLDGISGGLTYIDRMLDMGATRGDGEVGMNITRNVLLMQGVVKQLPPTMPDGTPTPKKVHVRGEIVVTHTDFAAHFKGKSNPRNTASGTAVRQSNHQTCAYLTFLAYNIILDGQPPIASKEAEFKTLETLGFRTARYVGLTGLAAVEKLYQEYINTIRDGLNYDIDGLVVEVDDTATRQALGERNHKPKGGTAYKFPHEAKPTTLRHIRWQVGASGRVTPVAEFDTVNLAGANVVQASLHNTSNIEDLWGKTVAPAAGDTILVSRRNDVIPYVEQLLSGMGQGTAFHTPSTCPECNKPLVMVGKYLVCKNEDECPAQASGLLKRWVSKIGVKHVGDAFITAAVEQGLVEDIAGLYEIDEDDADALDLGGRRAGGSGVKAVRNLKKAMTLPLHVIIGSLGIPLIGRSMAKIIIDAGFNSLSKLNKATKAQIGAIPMVGPTKAEAFIDGYWEKLPQLSRLIQVGIKVQDMSGPMLGQSVCLTGFRDSAMEAAIQKAGGEVKGSVSRSLTVLVCRDPNSTSGKAQTARKYGTEVIGIDEMWKRLGGKPV